MLSKSKHITIYTDGSCLKNGAVGGSDGGYGAILIYRNLLEVQNISNLNIQNTSFIKNDFKLNENFFFTSGHSSNTTNNQMELSGAIAGLELFIQSFNFDTQDAYKNEFLIEVHVDSQYVKNGINDWIHNWKKNNWRTAARTPVKNQGLWIELDKLNFLIKPSWHWVKGHSENIFNDLTDHIASNSAINQASVSESEVISRIECY